VKNFGYRHVLKKIEMPSQLGLGISKHKFEFAINHSIQSHSNTTVA
jgi:hypothetical protein